MPPKKSEPQMSEAEKKIIRDEFDKLCAKWEKALKPTDDEKVIVFPKSKIGWDDRPRWSVSTTPRLKIPDGPLVTMFAMYHWYRFLGRHLLQEEILELANRVFTGIKIKSVAIFDQIKNPKDNVREVFESLDDENRHQLGLRCDRWFKRYLSENPRASKKARYLLGL